MGEGGGADGGVSELQRLNANGVLFWDAAPAHHLEKWLDRWRSCIVPSLPCDRDVGTHHVDAQRNKLPKGQYVESVVVAGTSGELLFARRLPVAMMGCSTTK